MTIKKFSISAIALMILLAIRFIFNIYFFISFLNLSTNILGLLSVGVIFLTMIFYLFSLIGIFKKTRWGLNFALIISFLDMIIAVFFQVIYHNTGMLGAIVLDFILILLIINILKRINKHKIIHPEHIKTMKNNLPLLKNKHKIEIETSRVVGLITALVIIAFFFFGIKWGMISFVIGLFIVLIIYLIERKRIHKKN